MTRDRTDGNSATPLPSVMARVESAAQRVHEHEVALHAARQSGVDVWISAVAERLHDCIVEHSEALAAATNLSLPTVGKGTPRVAVSDDRAPVSIAQEGPGTGTDVPHRSPLPSTAETPDSGDWPGGRIDRTLLSPLEGIDVLLVQNQMRKLALSRTGVPLIEDVSC
jgi:hypothetical protein